MPTIHAGTREQKLDAMASMCEWLDERVLPEEPEYVALAEAEAFAEAREQLSELGLSLYLLHELELSSA